MHMRRKEYTILLVALVLMAIFFGTLSRPAWDATAAPAAIPTPLSIGRTTQVPTLVTFFDGQVVAADTRSQCFDSTYFDKMDLQYIIDIGTVNTTTLTLEFNNNRLTYPDGINAVANAAVDKDEMVEVNLFGVQTCIFADLTNTNTVTVTAIGLMK
jgi:hypothetical protein